VGVLKVHVDKRVLWRRVSRVCVPCQGLAFHGEPQDRFDERRGVWGQGERLLLCFLGRRKTVGGGEHKKIRPNQPKAKGWWGYKATTPIKTIIGRGHTVSTTAHLKKYYILDGGPRQ